MSAPSRGGFHWLAFLQVVDVDVVDPLAVERDDRVGDRAIAARDQQFLAAVRMQQHQVGPGSIVTGWEKSVKNRLWILSPARLART